VTVLSWFEVATEAWRAGFRGGDLVIATAVTEPESGRDTNARYVSSREDSRGLWQINTYAHPNFDRNRLYERGYNANAAYQVYRDAGFSFRPWTTYVDGKYRPYIGSAQSAVNAVLSGGSGAGEGTGPFPSTGGEGGGELQAPELAANLNWADWVQYSADRMGEGAGTLSNWTKVFRTLNTQ
jgi:hypothetical protein